MNKKTIVRQTITAGTFTEKNNENIGFPSSKGKSAGEAVVLQLLINSLWTGSNRESGEGCRSSLLYLLGPPFSSSFLSLDLLHFLVFSSSCMWEPHVRQRDCRQKQHAPRFTRIYQIARKTAVAAVLVRSALVNIRRKALGHLMKFTQGRLKYTWHQPQPKKGT